MSETDKFVPRWCRCLGSFTATSELSSDKNEALHYRKHAVVGREWGRTLSLIEYCTQAKGLLNSLDAEQVIEFQQIADQAVVKYDLHNGELGIAHWYSGDIKTYFRPNNLGYILRKVESGQWSEPDIATRLLSIEIPNEFDDEPEKSYLFQELQTLTVELPGATDGLLLQFAEQDQLNPWELLSLIAKVAQSRFLLYELKRWILTEDQFTRVFAYQKQLIYPQAALEVLDQQFSAQEKTIQTSLEELLLAQQIVWQSHKTYILSLDDMERALEQREMLEYCLIELRVQQANSRLQEINLPLLSHRLRKSDLYLRSAFFPLAAKFRYQNHHLISPTSFFWRMFAAHLPKTTDDDPSPTTHSPSENSIEKDQREPDIMWLSPKESSTS